MANILIIDDDYFYREFLVTAVRRKGHAAYDLPNGQGVLEAVRALSIDLVITDIFMPVVDGLEVLRCLRAHRPDMPVIALTGEVFDISDFYGRTAQRFGAIRVLVKPIKPAELDDCIAEVLHTAASDPVLAQSGGNGGG